MIKTIDNIDKYKLLSYCIWIFRYYTATEGNEIEMSSLLQLSFIDLPAVINLPACCDQLRNNIRKSVCDEIDGDLSIILKIWQEFSEHSDYTGTSKFKQFGTKFK